MSRDARAFWLAVAALLVAMWLLAGCATVDADIDFIERTARANATPSPNYPPLIVRVADPNAECRRNRIIVNMTVFGCADYKGTINAQTCTIYVGRDAPAWLIAHEKAHCKYGLWHK